MLNFIKKIVSGESTDYKKLINNGAVIIDVRSASEFATGHIPGSKNYPMDSINNKIAELKRLQKTVITVCRSGARSAIAKGILQSAGINVYNGGSWAGLRNKL